MFVLTSQKNWNRFRKFSLERNPIARWWKANYPEFDRHSVKFGRVLLRVLSTIVFVIGSTILLANIVTL